MKRFFRNLLLITVAVLSIQNGQLLQSQPGPEAIKLPAFTARTYNVMDFGTTGKGEVNDTPAIDKAIEKCSSEGGGELKFPAGTYLAASIHLKSKIRFVLDTQRKNRNHRQGQ